MKLIHTKDYSLLIDEEADVKRSKYIITSDLSSGVEERDGYSVSDLESYDFISIISYYPLTEEDKELDLPLLPNPFERIGGVIHWINKRLSDFTNNPQHIGDNEYNSILIIKRMLEAQSKQFSLEDVRKIAQSAFTIKSNNETLIEDFEKWFNSKIQSLITQQLPKEFIPEIVDNGEEDWIGDDINGEPFWNEKLELKTITNSEGKQELVGKYIL